MPEPSVHPASHPPLFPAGSRPTVNTVPGPSARCAPPRRGSVILIAGGILFVLLLLAGWFFQFMVMQNRLTHRQGQQRISTSLAFALATLAIQKIQREVVRDPASKLARYLKKPLSSLGDLPAAADTFVRLDQGATDLSPILREMVEPLSHLGAFSYEIQYSCRGSDFRPLRDSAYTREKRGLIHLAIATIFRKTGGTTLELREEFHFVTQVKVTAALVPILSKFTLYVEDARESSDVTDADASFRLNVVSNTATGNRTSPPDGLPWVLQNGCEGDARPDHLNDWITSRRGLVYLGGGRLYLNAARGSNPFGEFAEGFHFFNSGRGDGLYVFRKLQDTYLLNWDQGVTVETSGGGSRDWYDTIRESRWAPYLRKSSALRPYGTDRQPSPTIMLGEVYRSYIRTRAIKHTNPSSPYHFRPTFLTHQPAHDLTNWQEFISPAHAGERDNIATFNQFHLPSLFPELTQAGVNLPLTGSPQDLTIYNEVLASNWDRTPYNRSLAMIRANNLAPRPWVDLPEGPLKALMANPPNTTLVHAIPDALRPLTSAPDLKSMRALLQSLGIPGDRTAWVINPTAENRTILDCLKARGLAQGNTLDLNGWIYVDDAGDLRLTQKVVVQSNGGIVLKKGNIMIGHEISTIGPEAHLQLVTLDGDIIVDTNQKVQAGLVAHKGRVRVGAGGRGRITGAVAMSRFDLASVQQGVDLVYDTALGVLPGAVAEPDSEAPLLSCSVNPTPWFLK